MPIFYDEKAFAALLPHRRISGPAEDDVRRSVASLPMGGGWTSLAPDPMKLLRRYPPLKLKPGWVLRAYQYYAGGNGHCLVFAWPKAEPLPEPYDVLPFEERDPHWEQPCPQGSEPDFLRVLEGDRSPESYLMASFFARDVSAIGAYWHGGQWLDHSVLFENPLKRGKRTADDYDRFSRCEWTIEARLPQKFEPCVRRSRGATEVVFHTYCPIGRREVTRFVDRFGGDGMRFETRNTLLATAPGGIIH